MKGEMVIASLQYGGSHLRTRAVLILLGALFASGCVGIQHNTARVEPAILAGIGSTYRPRIAVTVPFVTRDPSGRGDPDRSGSDYVTALAERALENTGKFRIWVDAPTAEYRLVLNVDHTAHMRRGLLILTLMTLLLSPYWQTHNYVLVAELVSQDGTLIGRRQIDSRLDFYTQAFFLPAAPFATPTAAAERMWKQVLADVAAWASNLVLTPAALPKPTP